MIETIYSSEKSDHSRGVNNQFKMPKNIRQIGKGNPKKKIYIEDYVISFIKQLCKPESVEGQVAVLMGQFVKEEDCRNIFIQGAIKVEGLDVAGEFSFTNEIWTSIYEDIKNYFTDFEIVGWFLGGPGYLLDDKIKISKIHVDNFAGQDKTLLTYDSLEEEKSIYIYEGNHLAIQSGYNIYYVKNEEMQTYMVDYKEGAIGEEANFDNKITTDIRTILKEKSEQETKGPSGLMYIATTVMAIVVLAIGGAMLNNYEQMKSIEQTLDSLSKNINNVGLVEDKAPPLDAVETLAPGDEGENKVSDDLEAEDSENNVDEDLDDDDLDKTLDDKIDDETVIDDNGVVDNESAADDDIVVDSDSIVEDDESGSLDVIVLPGEVDTIEEAEPTKAAKDEKKDQSNGKTVDASKKDVEEAKYYKVLKGDTLAGISYKLYNSVEYIALIQELNNLESEDMIIEGQQLLLPK